MKRSRILSIILVLGLALTGCSTTKAQKVTIELESNPTTGYEWDDEQKEVSGEEIFEIEDEMIPSESDELGAPGVQKFVLLKTEVSGLFVSSFQPVLDEFLKSSGAQIDYIHGENEVFRLGAKENSIGILLPPVEKDSFFNTINEKGPLPRKSFSMGEADEKRFYLECRKLFQL